MKTLPRLIVDSADRSSDLRYACPFGTTGDAVVFLQHGKRRCVVVPVMEREHAAAMMRPLGGEVLTPADLGLSPSDRRRVSVWAYELLRSTGIREVAVGGSFPLVVADALRRRRIRIHVVPGSLYPEREIKSRRELGCCRESQRAAVAAVREAAAMIRDTTLDARGRLLYGGLVLTSEQVRVRIEQVLFDHHCTGPDTIVSCGPDSALPHHRGAGPLWAGRPIVIDIFPRHRRHGYHGDLTRTLVRGPAPARLRRMLEAVHSAQRAAMDRIRAGISAAAVHRAAGSVFGNLGMKTDLTAEPPRGFIHATGHGLGLDVHEAPTLGSGKHRLRAGQVVTVEPGWYEPGFGGVRIEDTVVVTGKGCRRLARCAARL